MAGDAAPEAVGACTLLPITAMTGVCGFAPLAAEAVAGTDVVAGPAGAVAGSVFSAGSALGCAAKATPMHSVKAASALLRHVWAKAGFGSHALGLRSAVTGR